MIRDDIKTALVTAMKSGDKAATGTIRLIQSALKNRDIELRTGTAPADDDLVVTEVLQKMIKQRRESADLYRKGNREELAATEEAEILVIGADVADVRESEGDDLLRVGRIGHHFLVSGHGGVEAQLADRFALGAEALAPDDPAIGEHHDSRRALRLRRGQGSSVGHGRKEPSVSVLQRCR